jgi:hypothetical protein
LLDTSVTDDDPAAGRDTRDLLDPIRLNANGARDYSSKRAAAKTTL